MKTLTQVVLVTKVTEGGTSGYNPDIVEIEAVITRREHSQPFGSMVYAYTRDITAMDTVREAQKRGELLRLTLHDGNNEDYGFRIIGCEPVGEMGHVA